MGWFRIKPHTVKSHPSQFRELIETEKISRRVCVGRGELARGRWFKARRGNDTDEMAGSR